MDNDPLLTPAYELADGDQAFLKEILESMATNIPVDLTEIEKAIEHGQLTLICRSAHHMKSSIMYTRAEELRQLLTEIEIKKDGHASLEEIKTLLPKVKQLAAQLVDAITGALKQ